MSDRAQSGFLRRRLRPHAGQSAQRLARNRAVGARRVVRCAAARSARTTMSPAAPADAELSRRARRRGHGAGPRRRTRPQLSGAERGRARALPAAAGRGVRYRSRRGRRALRRGARRPPIPAERSAAERALRAALTPPRVTLLRQFNALPEGVKFLVDRRAELIEHRRRRSGAARARRRSARPARQLVRYRVSRIAAGSPGNRRRRCSKS